MNIINFITTASFFTVATVSSVQAENNVQTAELAGKACVNYLTGYGVKNSFLEQYGFKKRSKSFVRRATGLGLTGHTDRADIKLHKSKCEYHFGTNRDARNAFRAAGFKEVIVKLGRRKIPAYQVGSKLYKLHGSTRTYNGSYSTLISVSAR